MSAAAGVITMAKYDQFKTAEIAKIHIAKKDLGLTDEIYRDIIREASGGKTESSGKLDWQGRHNALERFKELGWKAKISTKAVPRSEPSRRLADDPQSRMLRGMWIELHQAGIVRNPAESALCAFGKRLTRKDALQWYFDRDVTVVKEALKQMGERKKEAQDVA